MFPSINKRKKNESQFGDDMNLDSSNEYYEIVLVSNTSFDSELSNLMVNLNVYLNSS